MTFFFKDIQLAPPDAIFGLNQSFAADPRKSKVNLGVGVYRTEKLEPYILPTVKRAEKHLLEMETSKDYLPIDGLPSFIELSRRLIFGETDQTKIYGAQTVGGTGALRLGGAFLKQLGLHHLYLPGPSWDNHFRIFHHTGFLVANYPYYNSATRNFDCPAMLAAVEKMDKGSVILLHACCHNPTGCDPNLEQWKLIFNAIKEKSIFPFFDFAYQGFGVGLDADALPVRLAVDVGLECAVAVSYAKNFGLYAERCGALFIVCHDPLAVKRVGSQIKVLARGSYSNPPCHGALIVSTILKDQALKKSWEEDLLGMRKRIGQLRNLLATRLGFNHMKDQKGMFSYTGLSFNQVERLRNEYGIYMPPDGRINIAGLNLQNLDNIASAILNTPPEGH